LEEPAPDTMIFWRGIKKGDPQQMVRAGEVVFEAFTATSTKRSVAAAAAGKGGILQRIVVPKGSPIVHMEEHSVYKAECEWGLEGGSSFRVGRKVEMLPCDVPERYSDGSTRMIRTELPVVNLELTGNPLAAHLAQGRRDASAAKAAFAALGAAGHDDDDE
jgi:hypothetical protein